MEALPLPLGPEIQPAVRSQVKTPLTVSVPVTFSECPPLLAYVTLANCTPLAETFWLAALPWKVPARAPAETAPPAGVGSPPTRSVLAPARKAPAAWVKAPATVRFRPRLPVPP